MTWSASSEGGVRKGEPFPLPAPADIGRESYEQFEACVAAATELAKVVGPENGMVVVNFQGHANARHADPDGTADGPNSPEFVTVQVAALKRAETPKAKKTSKKT